MTDTSSASPSPPGQSNPPASGNLLETDRRRRAREREDSRHRRDETFRGLLAKGLLCLTGLVLVIVVFSLITLAWHMLLPGGADGFHWLCPAELRVVKDFMLSGAIVTLGTQYIRRYMEDR